MTTSFEYEKSAKYADLETIYANCSGPGGLKLAELIAYKLGLRPGARLLDVGTNHGYQTCFLAREYGVFVVGIDPYVDPDDEEGLYSVEHLARNARSWGVEDRILPIRIGVPDTGLATDWFDAVYSTTALEMIRGFDGEDRYRECLAEIHRVLRPGGLLGYGDPMHLEVDIPPDLLSLVTRGEPSWADCFATLDQTLDAFRSVGFEIVEADYAPDARLWWEEYARYDADGRPGDDPDSEAIRVDAGRWLSFGYVIARKAS
ncbi:MAG: class I SAM-dependent methyltransferase [Phycisphaerae bacterium]|nr:class I SAM-dependent methyltransferase [Phycisphaerae bacterium]